MSVYMEKRKGIPTGRFIIELEVQGVRLKDRAESKAEATRIEALMRAGEWSKDSTSRRKVPGWTLDQLSRDATCIEMCWPESDKDRMNSIRRFRECVDLIGPQVLLSDLGTEHIDGLIKALKGRKLAPSTINRYLAAFSNALKWANTRASTGFMGRRGTVHIQWFSEEGRERDAWLTPEEEQAIVRELLFSNENPRPDVALIVRVLGFTGCRIGEILNLPADDIDVSNESILLRTTKNGRARVQMLPRDIAQALKDLKQSGAQPGYRAIRDAFYRARDRVCPECPDITLHGIRHSVGTRAQIAGISIEEIAKYLGHARTRTTERYQHAASAQNRLTAQKLMNAGMIK